MSDVTIQPQDATLRLRKEDESEFRRLVFATYPVFLIAALVMWVLPRSGDQPRRSVFADAKALAYSTLPFAFMR